MARIPSFEEILLEIHQSLGLERLQTKYKAQFTDLGMALDKYAETGTELLNSIVAALDMDEQASHDFIDNLEEWAGFHKAVELHTWTGNASQEQVVWHLLAYSYVPALARRVAFWSLAGVEARRPLDPGMPGGKFWFLPELGEGKGVLTLPVTQVLGWLIDLLGEQSLEQAFPDAIRTLQGWRLEGRLPKSAKAIDQLFHDEANLDFRGAFVLREDKDPKEQFQAALEFVGRKGLNAASLADQIPMTLERLEPLMNETASEEERQEFVRLVALRYGRPTMRTIRQRLKVARMAQDGYQRLLAFLCSGVDADCADPARNKLLQLIGLFQTIYNLTIEAWKNGGGYEEQDAWFEARLASWDRADLLLSIMPSLSGEARYALLAERLTRKFLALDENGPLEDWVALSHEEAPAVIERRLRLLARERGEDQRLDRLIERVRASSPWRALQAEDSYWVVCQLAQSVEKKNLPEKVRQLAVERMRELASTPGQTVGAILLELGTLLLSDPKRWPRDIRQRVQSLFDEAEASPGYQKWEAPLLRLRARHRLMQNDFEGARADFNAALEACSKRAFGGLRGEIARDCFAAEVAAHGFVPKGRPKGPKGQEGYYRNMIGYGMFPEDVASFEDTAAWCGDFFWTDLYHPYPGFERREGAALLGFLAVLKGTLPLIAEADWEGLGRWFKHHAKTFQKAKLTDARLSSVLLQWLKQLHMLEPTRALAIKLEGAAGNLETFVANWRKAIRLLVEAWPEQARIVDFKGQTPLMLVADNGDAELTALLAPRSDVDAQDYRGRTALHAAVTGRSPECVALVLAHNPDVAKVSVGEENTALHTAVRVGVPESVRLILEEFPGLALQANAVGHTPSMMAREILKDLPRWRAFMQKNNRRVGSQAEFEAIVAVLESAEAEIC